jgi:hypothetical protein
MLIATWSFGLFARQAVLRRMAWRRNGPEKAARIARAFAEM